MKIRIPNFHYFSVHDELSYTSQKDSEKVVPVRERLATVEPPNAKKQPVNSCLSGKNRSISKCVTIQVGQNKLESSIGEISIRKYGVEHFEIEQFSPERQLFTVCFLR